MLNVLIPQAPTDVPAPKGSLEMDLPAQMGESWFSQSTVYVLSLEETVVKGGWNYYLCFYTWLVGECVFLLTL